MVVVVAMSASELLSEGNEAFVDENYELAVQKYSTAIEQNAFNPEYYIKRATAYIKIADYKAASVDASVAVDLDPKNHKAHLKKGISFFHCDDFKTAREAFTTGLELDKENKDMKMWIRKCEAELNLAEEEFGKSEGQNVAMGVASGQTSDKQQEPEKQQSSQINKEITKSIPQIPMLSPAKARYDWYQTETHVIISLMIKNSKEQDVNIEYGEQHLSVTVKLPSGSDYSLELELAHPIATSQCKTRILQSKIELKMKKTEAVRWQTLEGDDSTTVVKTFTSTDSKTKQSKAKSTVHQYPSSRHVVKDWDKLAADVAKEEADEKVEGEAALNDLFQKIYGDGSDEVKQAMNKSFIESGGTVLSTNWGEVGKEKVERKAPDGMEWRKWEH